MLRYQSHHLQGEKIDTDATSQRAIIKSAVLLFQSLETRSLIPNIKKNIAQTFGVFLRKTILFLNSGFHHLNTMLVVRQVTVHLF